MSKWIEDAVKERKEQLRQAAEDERISASVKQNKQLLVDNILEVEGIIVDRDSIYYGVVRNDCAELVYRDGRTDIRFNGYVQFCPVPEKLVIRQGAEWRWECKGAGYKSLVDAIIAIRPASDGGDDQ